MTNSLWMNFKTRGCSYISFAVLITVMLTCGQCLLYSEFTCEQPLHMWRQEFWGSVKVVLIKAIAVLSGVPMSMLASSMLGIYPT